ncbi:hypothetical protein CDD80_7515 [Ophiocordyceps camponoti-rufipedis]|uniref:HTH CENPB-type domain-containing protein n=1 Tax=Ophiocordyceps camponoti-rufipedis TaxID=2004952 RepID=A0A2C5XDH8_9HYPO|nr:hypothetical protein CDD80_7515 [Ophiocordyceps camponoti-rufipedis]
MMHTDMDGSAAMDPDSAMAQCHGYGGESWVDLSAYPGTFDDGTMGDYASFAQFMSHESMQQTQSNQQHLQMIQPGPPPPNMCHQQLPMLNTAWPSQLTNPTPTSSATTTGSFTTGPLASSKAAELVKQAGHQLEKMPRKTLSAEQKRAMCQYHDDNPGTRQADIGAKFGVERSTVSKVLRHRDQYLKREQEPDFALKRAKGKHPDFDRTLSNYVRRQQQRGFDVKDEGLMEQARLFARASGNQETLLNSLTTGWLHKFKLKHGIGLNNSNNNNNNNNNNNSNNSRRPSETSLTDERSVRKSTTSPVSPTLSPLSGSRSDEDAHHRDPLDFEMTFRRGGRRRSRSPAGSVTSPGGTISPAPAPFLTDYPAGDKKRSKTFPSIDVSFARGDDGGHGLTASSPSSSVQSPAPPPPPLFLVPSPEVLPSLEEARVAAMTLLSYMQRAGGGRFDQGEFGVVGQVAKKLQLSQQGVAQQQQQQQQQQHHLYHFHHGGQRASMGGLSRIPEGDDRSPTTSTTTTTNNNNNTNTTTTNTTQVR